MTCRMRLLGPLIVLAAVPGCGSVQVIDLNDSSPPGVDIVVSGFPGGDVTVGQSDMSRAAVSNDSLTLVVAATDAQSGVYSLNITGQIDFGCIESKVYVDHGPHGTVHRTVKSLVSKTQSLDQTISMRTLTGGLPTSRFVQIDLAKFGCTGAAQRTGGMAAKWMMAKLRASAENGAHATATTGTLTITFQTVRKTK